MSAKEITFGIKVNFNGKEVTGGVSVAREDFRRLAVDVKNSGKEMAGGATTAAEGVRSISTQLAALGGSISVIGQAGAAFAAVSAQALTLKASIATLIDTQLHYEKAVRQLQFATGSAVSAGESYRFIAVQANALGLELNSTAAAFGKFSSATKNTVLEGEKTRQIFVGISRAASTLGLTSDETSGAFLALTQMIGKGVVSAEEFRGQLAERIPVATQAAADALGVTTAEFSRMLESGEIVASEFLPLFARRLEELASSGGMAADSLQNEINRLTNSWTQLKQTVNESGVGNLIKREISGLATLMQGVRGEIEGTDRTLRNFMANAALMAAGTVIPGLGEIGRARMASPAAGMTGDPAASRTSSGKITGLKQEGEAVKDLTTAWAAYDKALGGFASKEEKRQANREKAVAAYARMMKEAAGNPEAQAGALEKLNNALRNIDATEKKTGATRTGNSAAATAALNEEAAALAKIMGTSRNYQNELAAIQRLRDQGRITAEEQTAAVTRLYLTETEAGKAAAKAMQEENKRNAEAVLEMVKEYDDLEKSLQATTQAVNSYVAGLEYANQEREIEIQALAMAEPERAAYIQQKREELALEREIARLSVDDATARRMRDALAVSQLNEGMLLAAKRATQEWDKFTDDVERSLTDSLMRAGETGGRGAGDIIVDSIKNTLKTAAFKIPVQAVVEPVMDAGRSVLASTPGAGNLLGVASNASTLYSAYNNFAGAGGYAAQVGAWLDGVMGTAGTASQGAMLMAQSAAFEGSQAALLLEQTEVFGAVGEALTAEAAGVGAGMAEGFLAAVPGWGWAVAAGLALFGGDLLGSKGGPKIEGTYSEFGAEYQVRSGALNQTAADFARSAEVAYEAVARIYGLADASLRSYAEISTDPAGDAMTQLGLIVERAGRVVYDRSAEHGGTENVGRSEEELRAAMADAVSEAVLYAVARADGMPAAVDALFDTFESGIADLSVERSSALATALTGGWLDDLLTTLDESALGLSGVADAAVKLAAKLPALAQQTGLTAEAIGTSFHTALTESAGAAQAGQIFADGIVGSVHTAMQTGYEQQITGLMMDSIINPVLVAVATGGDIAAALSAGIIDDAVARIDAMAGAYNALMSSPEFTSAMERIRAATSRAGTAAWVPDYNAQAARTASAAASAAESAARAAEDAARAMLSAQTSLVDAQVSLIQGLQSAAADWRALSTSLDQDILRLSRLDPAFDAVGHYTGQITGLMSDWYDLANSARDPASLSYQHEQADLASQIHRAAMDRYDAELEALQRSADATRDMAQSSLDLRRYVDGLRTGDLSPLTMGQKLAEAASQYQSTLARAQGGDADARGRLSAVSDTYLKLAQGYYAGASTDYSEVFRAVTGAIEGLAQPTRSTEELLSDIRGADAAYNTAALDIARRAQNDLAIIKSVTDTRLAEVNDSIIGLGGALRGYLATHPGVAANTTIPDTVYSAMGQTAPVAANVSNPDGRPAYTAITQSHDQIRDLIAQSGIADGQTLYREIVRHRLDPYAVGAAYGLDRAGMDAWLDSQNVVRVPGFAVGTNNLPADMLAMVHQDERIVPAADNRELFRRLAAPEENAAALLAEIALLRVEVAALRADNQRQTAQLAGAVENSNQGNADQISGAIERSAQTRRSRAGSMLL